MFGIDEMARECGVSAADQVDCCEPTRPITTYAELDECRKAMSANRACHAAAKLFRPPYMRHGIGLTPREQADWNDLRELLEAAGVEIGEELT